MFLYHTARDLLPRSLARDRKCQIVVARDEPASWCTDGNQHAPRFIPNLNGAPTRVARVQVSCPQISCIEKKHLSLLGEFEVGDGTVNTLESKWKTTFQYTSILLPDWLNFH